MNKKLGITLILQFLLLLSFSQSTVTFVIDDLPNTTPEEDSIFICGNINNWQVNNPEYMLHRQLDGKYSITLSSDSTRIVYKFSRGSWLKIETNEKNEHLDDRIHFMGKEGVVSVKILNWQDLGGIGRFQYLVFFFFAAAFYGIALLFIAFRIKNRSRERFTAFLLLSIPIIVILLGGVVYNQLNLIWKSYLAMMGQLLLFCWGPILFISLKALKDQVFPSRWLIHFTTLVLILVIFTFRMLNFEAISFMAYELTPHLSLGNFIIIWLGFIIIFIYHLISFKFVTINPTKKSHVGNDKKLITTIFILSALSTFTIAINNVLLLLNFQIGGLANFEFVLILLSLIILAIFYYLWKYPEVIKGKHGGLVLDDEDGLKLQLIKVMNDKKPFKNPDLNIAELSEMINSKPHILSKLINDSLNKNFRDFINEYRVQEFIHLASSEEYKNFTFLALAYEVGFNSKSTFNLAFKKIMKVSPRDYFRTIKV